MKGIILAGGTGSRLFPITMGLSKQLLPVYDKPMIYYPLSVLMLAGIKDILIIVTPEQQSLFYSLLGDGTRFGVNISYGVQAEPKGLAQALIIGEDFIGDDSVCLVLGDNIFFGQGFSEQIKRAAKTVESESYAVIFGYPVNQPQHFGIVEIDEQQNPLSIEEKPETPKSNLAVTGLYFFDNRAAKIARGISPSPRGELEITDVNQFYLEEKSLKVQLLGRGVAWFDTGTHESLLKASMFVETIQERQGYYIACLEEIAYSNGWLRKEDLINASVMHEKSSYGNYLKRLLHD